MVSEHKAVILDAKGNPVCALSWPNFSRTKKQTRQLGQQIAATPDLLAACKIILDCERNGWPPDERQFKMIREATAKAEGRAV